MEWAKNWVEARHFEGWKRWRTPTQRDVPPGRGVYVVVGDLERSRFLVDGVDGARKGVPLTVDAEELEAAWTGSEFLSIGKADGAGGLRDRVRAYARRGCGDSAGHFGGRYLWRHPASNVMRVGWRATGELDPEESRRAFSPPSVTSSVTVRSSI